MYIVTAYRYGDTETHSYVLGVFGTEEIARTVSEYECDYRGGKYSCKVIQCSMNESVKDNQKSFWVE